MVHVYELMLCLFRLVFLWVGQVFIYYSAAFCTIIECLIQYGVSEAMQGI